MKFQATSNSRVFIHRDCNCRVEFTPYNVFLWPCLVHSLDECKAESERMLNLAARERGQYRRARAG